MDAKFQVAVIKRFCGDSNTVMYKITKGQKAEKNDIKKVENINTKRNQYSKQRQ